MPKSKINFDAVRKLGLALPYVEESTAYGSPALKVRGKLLACLAVHRSAEPDSLVVCVDFTDRARLLAEAPDTYYVTDHYIAYQSVLVRMSRINTNALRGLLRMAYNFVTRKVPTRLRTNQRRKARPSSPD